MEMIPKVVQAVAGENFTVYAYFHDGTVRLYDMTPVLNMGGIFEPLKSDEKFRDCITVINGTVAWDIDGSRNPTTCIDIDPVTIYENSLIVKDPLESNTLHVAEETFTYE